MTDCEDHRFSGTGFHNLKLVKLNIDSALRSGQSRKLIGNLSHFQLLTYRLWNPSSCTGDNRVISRFAIPTTCMWIIKCTIKQKMTAFARLTWKFDSSVPYNGFC